MLTAWDAHNLTKHFRHVVTETDKEILAACNDGKFEVKITDESLLMKIRSCFNVFLQHYETSGYEVDFAMEHNTLRWEHVKQDHISELKPSLQ